MTGAPLLDLRRAVACALLCAALAGCATDEDFADDVRPAEDIFAEAQALEAEGDMLGAAALYDDVERLYPYAQIAKDAVLASARANYIGGKYDEARLGAERFLSFYPSDPAAAEAQYLIALTWYDRIVDVGRDQGATREALAALRETVSRYPGTEYARAAALKLDLANDHLAGKEMEIGRYYLKRDLHIAAINRFRSVIENHQTSSHTPEALHRLVEAYLELGVISEAQTAAAVLGHNFPGSDWYLRSYALLTGVEAAPIENRDSWISRSYRQVVKGEWL
ncbi:MAG: outer membrane protein assembly factor BamD [Rubrimonas sp.]|uniref:outer membrane protein assembly factor BamD n=1 Tax=Rubrimonas sp. TaxID=2036015 RepID=UPI002FDEE6CD